MTTSRRSGWCSTEGEPGTVYNVGAGNEVTNLDLTHRLLDLLRQADESSIEFVTDRPGHDRRYSVDTTRIRELGWTPDHDPRRGTCRHRGLVPRPREDWWRPLKDAGASQRRGV